MVQSKAFIFAKAPDGWPVPGEHMKVETRTVDIDSEPPKDGLVTKNIYASFDPYLRGRMRNPGTDYYSAPLTLGEPFQNRCVAKVLKSGNEKFKAGDLVVGTMNIEEYSIVPPEVAKGLTKLENPYNLDPSIFVGALGMPGLTAYSSLYEIGKPKKGETILVSAASGAVGQLVGQLAKHEAMRVVGSVGNDDKLAFIQKELGFDGGFNYKKEKPADALKRLCPKGVDIYYENVGGEQLEAALDAMADFGRIGESSEVMPGEGNGLEANAYNSPPSKRYGIKNLFQVIGKRIHMQGFIVGDPNMGPKYAKEHRERVSKWIHEGTFKVKQSVTDGIDNAPNGFLGMLKGENFGKAVLKIADLD